jgi:hypothetical protein
MKLRSLFFRIFADRSRSNPLKVIDLTTMEIPREYQAKLVPLIAHIGLTQDQTQDEEDVIVDYLTTLKSAILNKLSSDPLISLLQLDTVPVYRKQKPHSLLSPLSHSSPLYPDGLITPSWLDKHLTKLPACLLHFVDLYERDSRLEKDRDLITCSVINESRKAASDRGIRYFVVIILKTRSHGVCFWELILYRTS